MCTFWTTWDRAVTVTVEVVKTRIKYAHKWKTMELEDRGAFSKRLNPDW